MAEDNTKKEIQYCRKIRFYPTSEFKILAEKCFGATRYLINKAIEGIKNKTITKPTNHISVRNAVMKSNKELLLPENKEEKWLKEVPSATRQLAIKQLASNYKTGFTQLKNKTIDKFEMKFKSKKNPYQYFFVDKRALNPSKLKIFSRKSKNPFRLRKKQERWWKNNILKSNHNIIIRREKNRYYMCIPRKKETWNSGRFRFEHKHNCVSLDPGVRTFQTIYSEEGIAGKIGHNACENLIDIGLKVDKLRSFLDKSKGLKKKNRYNIRKRCFLLRTKIKNKVTDLHWKTANYLCSTFKHIFLPNFETSNMIRKDLPYRARRINSKTVRNMLSLSHFKFKQRILYLSSYYGSKVHLCGEHYTTKACGGCGLLNIIGGNKVYNCRSCKFTMDRDYNGARNIYMKQIQ
jgi:putative transposase